MVQFRTNRVAFLALLIAFVCLIPFDSFGEMPVFPGAKGFGTETVAGRLGQVMRVTNVDPDGPGSFRQALEASGPRVVVFQVSGTIQIDGAVRITNPYITIAGQTAPSPGITLRGCTIYIQTHDVLIQHIRIRVGDKGGIDAFKRDGIDVAGEGKNGVYNVVVDHCSISWGIDENCGLSGRDITFSNCIISEGLSNSIHPKGEHSKGMIIGEAYNASIIGCLFAHNVSRNPYVVYGPQSVALINNVIYNAKDFGLQVQTNAGVTDLSMVNNVIVKGPNSGQYASQVMGSLRGALYQGGVGSRMYFFGNMTTAGVQINSADWTMIDNRYKYNIELFRATGESPDYSAPVWPGGLTLLDVADVRESVSRNSGAWPADRDAVDARVINDMTSGTGKIVNSQDEVGGWPDLAVNTRQLNLPQNPSADDDGDGYTNIEEMLHSMAATVEGRGQSGPPLEAPRVWLIEN